MFRALRAENVGASVHYLPVHLHPFYRERFGTGRGLCPAAEDGRRPAPHVAAVSPDDRRRCRGRDRGGGEGDPVGTKMTRARRVAPSPGGAPGSEEAERRPMRERQSSTIRVFTPRPPIRLAASVREIWTFRATSWQLAGREVRIRYKQALLGAAWALLQPLSLMIVFTVFFSRFLNVPSATACPILFCLLRAPAVGLFCQLSVLFHYQPDR